MLMGKFPVIEPCNKIENNSLKTFFLKKRFCAVTKLFNPLSFHWASNRGPGADRGPGAEPPSVVPVEDVT